MNTQAWQPIETAPKDGSWILLKGGKIDYGWCGASQPPVVVAQFAGQCWQFAWYDGGYFGEYESPSAWMPVMDDKEHGGIVEHGGSCDCCGIRLANESHACPKMSEVYEDEEECNCCDVCTAQCADEI